ncbi:MAG: DUF559 domain-containing protein [Rhodospirillales bacterium]
MNTQLQRARELRTHMTPPEARLWRQLRSRRLFGLKFKRQVPLGPYIADFICEEAGLVVEIDGDTHAVQIAYDRHRDRFMNRAGYRVLRFGNRDVMGNLEGVLYRIAEACGR